MDFESTQLLNTPAVRIARARPGDAGRIEAFYLGLSPESRYQRFFSHRPQYLAEELARLSHPDWQRELCLLALAGEGDDAVVVGDLRCVPGEPASAAVRRREKEGEIALVVADAWRRRGIGRLLLCNLIAHARRDAYTGLLAYVASGNAGMLKLLREFDFRFEPIAGGAAMRLLRRALVHAPFAPGAQPVEPGCRGFGLVLEGLGAGAAASAAAH